MVVGKTAIRLEEKIAIAGNRKTKFVVTIKTEISVIQAQILSQNEIETDRNDNFCIRQTASQGAFDGMLKTLRYKYPMHVNICHHVKNVFNFTNTRINTFYFQLLKVFSPRGLYVAKEKSSHI